MPFEIAGIGFFTLMLKLMRVFVLKVQKIISLENMEK